MSIPKATCYSSFGFQLTSDLALPELIPHQDLVKIDPPVRICSGAHQSWPPIRSSPWSTPALQLASGEWRLSLEGIGWFRVSEGTLLEWQRWDDSVSERDLRTFLLTSGIGALAIQRGLLVLHGTALARRGEAVVLLGRPATGKSTLAWCLLQQGWHLLSSELVAMDAEGRVWPGIQQLKLWHNSVEALGLNWSDLRMVRRGLRRYAWQPKIPSCSAESVPIRCCYLLQRSKEGSTRDDGAPLDSIRVTTSFGQQLALLNLRNHAFHARVYRGMGLEGELFRQASFLARTVPVHRLILPDTIAAMCRELNSLNLLEPASLPAISELSDNV